MNVSGPKKSPAPARAEVPSGTVPARPSSLDSGSHRSLPQVTPSTPFQGGAPSPNEQPARAAAPEWRERPATPHGPGIPVLDLATVPMMKTPAPVAAHQASSNPPAPRPFPRDMLVTQPRTPGPFLPHPPKPAAAPAPRAPVQAPVFASPSFEELPATAAPPARLRCVAAWCIDALCIVGLLAGLLAVVTPSAFGELRLVLASRPSGIEWAQQFVPVLAAGALIGFIYVAFFGFAAGGVSPGRGLAGLRLVEGTGEAPGPIRSVLRAALSLLSFALGALGFVLALVTPRRQTLHDLLSGTAPVRR